ncbi:MAG: maleylacetoacetate isomerase [Pseudomonadaceae bacterium]|nr:maleylacetoacetate isomerase [Pseudomonadaceae bacterium]
MKLYDFAPSSAAYRVRIALNLKGLSADRVDVNLTDSEHLTDAYRAVNAQSLVPSLEHEGAVLTQSLAILEYLDERFPQRPLLPQDLVQRAQQRALAYSVACEIHPIQNLRIRRYLASEMGQDEAATNQWVRHWIDLGLQAIETQAPQAGFLGGTQPMFADLVVVPQVFNAVRFGADVDSIPRLMGIYERCNALAAFADAHPSAPAS